MRQAHSLTILAILMLVIASPGLASVLAPPSNLGELARISGTVVFAEAEGKQTELRGGTPVTVTTFKVLQQVAGKPLGRNFEVQEVGGVVGDAGMAVSGAPAFEQGGRYLLFLDPMAGGRWQTKMLAYGVLREEAGVLRPIAAAEDLHLLPRPGIERIGEYRKESLFQHLSAVAAGSAPWNASAVAVSGTEKAGAAEKGSELGMTGAALTSAPPACRFVLAVETDNLPLRWFGMETGGSTSVWHTTPGQVGISDGGVSAVQEGAAAWTNHADSKITLNYAGSKPTTANCADGNARDRNNEVIFNDPCNQIPALATCTGPTPPGWTSPCCGMVGIYGTAYTQSNIAQHDGDNWHPAEAMSIVINNGSQCVGEVDFKEIVTHFLGHGLGFEHHTDTNATMHGELGAHASRGAAIANTDKVCAAYAYHTFKDVSQPYWAWANIEALDNASITTGCAPGMYCPLGLVRRDEISAFLERGIHGGGFTPPPPTGTVFSDVPASFWAAGYIEQMAADGITAGCGGGKYCPLDPLLRAEMAVFLLRAKHGGSYVPPPGTGTIFSDVPASHWAVSWIEQLYNEGITTGCAPGMYCPDNTVRRDEMAAFLVRTFALPVP